MTNSNRKPNSTGATRRFWRRRLSVLPLDAVSGAFNDNVYKMIVSVMARSDRRRPARAGARYLALAGAVFVLPFLLFAGPAGQIADRFSKTRVLQITKAFEIADRC